MSCFQNIESASIIGEPTVDKEVVVGIDFGTTFSGISIAYKANPTDLTTTAPETRGPQCKVPTILLRTHTGQWYFGNQAIEQSTIEVNPYDLYERFKLHLAEIETPDVMVKSLQNHEVSLLLLIQKTLSYLKDHAMTLVQNGFGRHIRKATDIQWVLTVPAIWNYKAKAIMRQAAHLAGLMGEMGPEARNLVLVPEPEAAAIDTHVRMAYLDFLEPNDKFMVVDLGGGTADITVHKFISKSPIKLDCIAAPAGGEYGSSFINQEFRSFLKRLSGLNDAAFSRHELENYSEYTAVYNEFEMMKCNFSGGVPGGIGQDIFTVEEITRKVAIYNQAYPSMTCSVRGRRLNLSTELMMSFYRGILSSVSLKITEILNLVASNGLNDIIVVGGFGNSKVIQDRIKQDFRTKRVTCPGHPQESVVQGAVRYGMYSIIRTRVAVMTLAVRIHQNGDDNRLHILLRRNQVIPENHTASFVGLPQSDDQTIVSLQVYASNLDNPVSTEQGTRLGKVNVPCPRIGNQSTTDREMTTIFTFRAVDIYVDNVNHQNVRTVGSIDYLSN